MLAIEPTKGYVLVIRHTLHIAGTGRPGTSDCLESIGKEWPQEHARRIYRRIGDHEDYLRLRALKMKYGGDYHDLATFYWEQGEKKQRHSSALMLPPSNP